MVLRATVRAKEVRTSDVRDSGLKFADRFEKVSANFYRDSVSSLPEVDKKRGSKIRVVSKR